MIKVKIRIPNQYDFIYITINDLQIIKEKPSDKG
jgi:hypothetical protein